MNLGFFPHIFNVRENEDYIGPYPDAAMYGPSEMTAPKRNAFYKWYNVASKEGEFNMRKVSGFQNVLYDSHPEFFHRNSFDTLKQTLIFY